MGGQVHMGRCNQLGWGHDSDQNNYQIIYNIFFQRKVSFMVVFKEKIVLIFTSLLLKGHVQTVV